MWNEGRVEWSGGMWEGWSGVNGVIVEMLVVAMFVVVFRTRQGGKRGRK